jgi:hypothetical protein
MTGTITKTDRRAQRSRQAILDATRELLADCDVRTLTSTTSPRTRTPTIQHNIDPAPTQGHIRPEPVMNRGICLTPLAILAREPWRHCPQWTDNPPSAVHPLPPRVIVL